MADPKLTIADATAIAARTGHSVSTVWRLLRGGRSRRSTRLAVEAAARELGIALSGNGR